MLNKTRYKHKSENDKKRELMKNKCVISKKDECCIPIQLNKDKCCIQLNKNDCNTLIKNDINELYKTIENLKLCVIDLKKQVSNSPSNYHIGKIKINIDNLHDLYVCLNYISFNNTIFIYGSYNGCITINDLKSTIKLIDSCFNLTCYESSGTIDILNHNNDTIYNAIVLDKLKMEISSRPLIPIGINFNGTINFDIKIHFN